MTVFAKKQDWSDRSLTKQAVTPMRRYKDLFGPVIDKRPVFPTFHLPTLYKTLRTRLHDEHSWSENKIETFVDDLTGQAEIFEAPMSTSWRRLRSTPMVLVESCAGSVRKPISNSRGNTTISSPTVDVEVLVR
ncbi:hypothetical protein [Haloterrigena turkmenica]|uniref:hypothetical protein n=1 Tax=Haloterrigena turkmenica TaxID=62320 RepID=UPI0006779685|nr:hypothetical protein [Haloterrigena turkmenica]